MIPKLFKLQSIQQFEEQRAVYPYTEEELDYITRIYRDLQYDITLKNEPQNLLSNRTLKQMWDESQDNFVVITAQDRPDNEFKEYRRTLTRDGLNDFLASMGSKLIYPTIFAQNDEQEIDRIVSHTLSKLYEYTENNDGKPTTSGHEKFIQYEYQRLIEGTVHVQDDYDPITKKFVRNLVPNTEIFIPNFWQPDIQQQPHLFRFQSKILYWEAERLYGHLPNWKYVVPGDLPNWQYTQFRTFENWNMGLIRQDQVGIVHCWYDVPVAERKDPAKPEKYYNIIINGVPMFAPDNKSPYDHGCYPIYKGIFERLHPRYYWGNSFPNKTGPDQKIADTLFTIMINRTKLNLLPPMVSMNGLHIEQDWIGFAKVTEIDGDINNFKRIPGVADPVTNTDLEMLSLVENAERGENPHLATQPYGPRQPATTTMVYQNNALKALQLYGLFASFMVEAGAYLRLSNIIQFMPEEDIEELTRVSIPNTDVGDGRHGTLEVLFLDPGKMTEEELLLKSNVLAQQEEKSNQETGQTKRIVHINPAYLKDLSLYVVVSANPVDKKDTELEKVIAVNNYNNVYRNNPYVQQIPALRNVMRKLGDNENELIQMTQPTPAGQPGQTPGEATPSGQPASGQGSNVNQQALQALVPHTPTAVQGMMGR